MLPKKKRLNTKLFLGVLQSGKVFHSVHLTLRVYKLNSDEPNRWAFSVSKKIDTRATKRNLIRRRLASIVSTYENFISKGYGYIFFAKKGILEVSFQELEQEVRMLLTTLKK